MNSIEVDGLTKRYGRIEALVGTDLSVGRGEVFGLVGPNGAGKTTLIKGLVGALRPSGGTARVMGLNPLKDRAELRQRIGYMPQGPALYDDLSGRADDPVHTFSGGMKRRVSLACALVHRPEVIFLDEPTAAVDPQLRSRFWKTFRELAGDGATLFISTHLMNEAMLCDRIALLRKGRIIATDTPRSILEEGRTRLTVVHDDTDTKETIGGHPEDLAAALRPYGLQPGVTAIGVETDSLEAVVLSLIEKAEVG